MAELWEMSADGLTYTFKIRKDAKWADGKPVTAQDFVYGLIRLVDPNPPAPNGSYAFQGFYLVNGEAFNKGEGSKTPPQYGAKALDDNTLELKLVTPGALLHPADGLRLLLPRPQGLRRPIPEWSMPLSSEKDHGQRPLRAHHLEPRAGTSSSRRTPTIGTKTPSSSTRLRSSSSVDENTGAEHVRDGLVLPGQHPQGLHPQIRR